MRLTLLFIFFSQFLDAQKKFGIVPVSNTDTPIENVTVCFEQGKIENNNMPTSINIKELDSLNINISPI